MSDDGRTVAVTGVYTPNTNELEENHLRVIVFEEINDAWILKGSKIENSSRTTEFLDDSKAHVSLSGDGNKIAVATIYIKSRTIVSQSDREGSVVIYEFVNGDWVLTSTEYTGDAGVNHGALQLGLVASLNTDGSKIAIGMRYFDDVGGESSADHNIGAVIVCNVGDSASCQTIATGNSANDYVGSSVMISGSDNPSCVVFGSSGSDTTNGINSGSASVYCNGANGTWSRRGGFLSGESVFDQFGSSVAISSDSTFIAVGAFLNDRDAHKSDDNGGHVRVYKFDIDANSYIQIGSDIDGERGGSDSGGFYYEGDMSGYSVALSDRRQDGLLRVAIGAPNNDGGGGYYNGHVRLHECNPEDSSPTWVQVLDDLDGEMVKESAGRSVSISNDGSRIIVGSPDYQNNAVGYYAGSAVVYEQTEFSSSPSSAPSSSPTISTKIISSPQQEMVMSGVETLSVTAIDHWKSTAKTMILEVIPVDYSVKSIDVIILSINGVQYDEVQHKRRRDLFEKADTDFAIVYEIVLTAIVEEEEAAFDESLKSTVSEVLENSEFVENLKEENDFAGVIEVKTFEILDAFQIRSNSNQLDFSGNVTWCLQASSIALDSRLNVKICDPSEKLQLWATDAFGQLKLAAYPNNPTCIRTRLNRAFLDVCQKASQNLSRKNQAQSFTFEDNAGGTLIRQPAVNKRNADRFIGLEFGIENVPVEIKVYTSGESNDSLNKWKVMRGKYSTRFESWESD